MAGLHITDTITLLRQGRHEAAGVSLDIRWGSRRITTPTIMIGQLTAQVNAANCMLDFINSYFMLFTNYVSLAIEFSGLLHSVYLVQIF